MGFKTGSGGDWKPVPEGDYEKAYFVRTKRVDRKTYADRNKPDNEAEVETQFRLIFSVKTEEGWQAATMTVRDSYYDGTGKAPTPSGLYEVLSAMLGEYKPPKPPTKPKPSDAALSVTLNAPDGEEFRIFEGQRYGLAIDEKGYIVRSSIYRLPGEPCLNDPEVIMKAKEGYEARVAAMNATCGLKDKAETEDAKGEEEDDPFADD